MFYCILKSVELIKENIMFKRILLSSIAACACSCIAICTQDEALETDLEVTQGIVSSLDVVSNENIVDEQVSEPVEKINEQVGYEELNAYGC
jgi:hypothetical protein